MIQPHSKYNLDGVFTYVWVSVFYKTAIHSLCKIFFLWILRFMTASCLKEGTIIMSEETHLKIEIPLEDETVYKPEQSSSTVKDVAKQSGKTVANTAVSAWQSDSRKKVTGPVRRGFTAVTVKTGLAIQHQVSKVVEKKMKEERAAMQTRLQETDWTAEAKKGTAKGFNWLSQKAQNLSERIKREE